MAKRYIDANAITYQEHTECLGHGWYETVQTVTKEEIDKIPAADIAEVKHGEWNYEGEYKVCSLCGTFVEWDTLGANYCPYCGAKMDLTNF